MSGSKRKASSSLDQALIAAVEAHRLEEVRDLLARGADPDAKKGKGRALDLVHPRREDIAYALVEAGASAASDKGLVWGVHSRRLGVVEALLAQGADPNLSTPAGTPLQGEDALSTARLFKRGAAVAALQKAKRPPGRTRRS